MLSTDLQSLLISFLASHSIGLHNLDSDNLDRVLKWKLTVDLRFLKLSIVSLQLLNAKMIAAFPTPISHLTGPTLDSYPQTAPSTGTHCVCKEARFRLSVSPAFVFCLFCFRLSSSGSCLLRTSPLGEHFILSWKSFAKFLNSAWGEMWLCSRVSPSLQFTQGSGNC